MSAKDSEFGYRPFLDPEGNGKSIYAVRFSGEDGQEVMSDLMSFHQAREMVERTGGTLMIFDADIFLGSGKDDMPPIDGTEWTGDA